MLSPISLTTVSFIFFAKGHGYPIGLPRWMHEAKTIVSAPRSTISLALNTAFLPGQPPQEIKQIISMSSFIHSKAHDFSRITLKSVEPGQ